MVSVAIFAGSTWLFHQSFLHNIFLLGSPYNPQRFAADCFETFQTDSEMSVTLMMEKTERDGLDSTHGFMLGRSLDGEPYMSAWGLQGKVFSLMNSLTGGNVNATTKAGHFWVALLTALMFAAFSLFLRKEFGLVTMVVFIFGVCISPWLVFAARNLYLVYFLHLLPFVLSFMLYSYYLDHPKFKWWYLAIIGCSILLKSLCFFDYSSNIVLSIVAAPIYFGIARHKPWKETLRISIALLIVGGTAVAIAILANVAQIIAYKQSFASALDYFSDTVFSRMYGSSMSGKAASSDVSLFQILGQYWTLPALNLPFRPRPAYRIYLSFYAAASTFFTLAALTLADRRWLPRFEPQRGKLWGLAMAGCWGLLATLSWGFLMKGHMFHHIHMNGMIFYIPFMLIFYILTGKVLGLAGEQLMALMKKRGTAAG